MKTLLLSLTMSLAIAFNASGQTDFFWSFSEPFRDVEFENADAARLFEIGETGLIYLFYTTNGPSDAEISEAFFLDIALSANGIVEFENASTEDFQVGLNCALEFFGTRWNENGGGEFGETGVVQANFIDELHAVRGVSDGDLWGLIDATTSIDSIFCDHGHLIVRGYDVDAFYVAVVQFDTLTPGTVELQTSIGSGGIWNDGKPVTDLLFGGATITVALLGDVNLDGVINLLDVAPFVELLSNGGYQAEADINKDGIVSLLDVTPFVDLLAGG